MLSKRAKIAETTPETTKKATKTKRRKLTEEEEEDETPLTGILCLKQRQDMKVFEEKEDCFILDFDPNDSFDHSKELSSSDNPEGDDDDVAIVHEKGQVACRDFPHPRHLCSKYPFETTNHLLHCDKCYCYVCDVAAPCPFWNPVYYGSHCEAKEEKKWQHLRKLFQQKRRDYF
ncbi:hypothetical protein Bca52824_091392 [Brassica carinata]|uniref:Uncharacterized protein n=1 Tax=Brassica carinata TaxID=52824 RepID=A0A8X7TG62_BRACI|nr:hypothetical protein Bca52824_091392 [Brassica carinata]